MLSLDVMFHAEPEKILIEDLPEGMSRIMLRANMLQKASPGDVMMNEGENQTLVETTSWYADEAYMECPTPDRPTYEELDADFERWYTNISNWSKVVQTDTIQTLRTAIDDNHAQINMLTECILEMSAQVYAEA